MTNKEFAAGLRMIADFYDQHEDMKQPYSNLWVHCWEREAFITAAATLSRGGMVRKSADDPHGLCPEFRATRDFGGVKVEVKIDRKTVCRLVRPAEYDCPESLLEESKEYSEA